MQAVDLAYYLGVSESTVSRLLSGTRRPSLDLIIKIRGVLEWSVEDQAWTLERHDLTVYGARLRTKMEAANVDSRPRRETMRSLQGPGTGTRGL